MLVELQIRNYALIDHLVLELAPGLNVITGETGAGKSIILGALSLVLGERADPDLIRAGASEAQVQARFSAIPDAVFARLQEMGIEAPDRTLILRRKVDRTGRSVAYANDTAVTIHALSQIGDCLIDLHGQHQHQLLLKPEIHRELLDRYGQLTDQCKEFAQDYARLLQLRAELDALEKDLAERRRRRDLTAYQAQELAAAGIRKGELAALQEESQLLASAERRYALAQELEALLSEQEPSACGLLAIAEKKLAELAGLDATFSSWCEVLATARMQLEEFVRAVSSYRDRIEFSPARSEEVNSRLFLIQKLEKKYGLPADELPDLQEKLTQELNSVELDETRCEELREQLADMEQSLLTRARRLSRARRQAGAKMEKEMEKACTQLGLEKARLSVQISAPDSPDASLLSPAGFDTVEFLFSANPGEPLKPLRKVASGGELSRLMLAAKSVLTSTSMVPIMVFDEIDSGIGGRIAERVGRTLRHLGQTQQVICITHLPQIAQYADNHYVVTKQDKRGRSVTSITPLQGQSRIQELARMIAGEKITETSLARAREMLREAGK